MTDNRIEKIRVEIEKAYSEAQKRAKLVKDVYWEGKVDAYRNVLCVFDLMQEEPVAPKVLEDMLNAKTAAESLGISQEEHDRIVDELIYGKEPELVDVDDLPNKEEEPVSEIDFEQELYKAFGHVKDFTLGMRIAKRFYDMGRNHQEPVSRTPADIEAAMQEVEEKSRAFTEAHHGEAADTILAQMRGEEPISKDLEKMSYRSAMDLINNPKFLPTTTFGELIPMLQKLYKDGARWQKENLWKPADGDDLPEIDREVVALLDNGKIVFAHRPPEYWDGKNIITGKVTRHYPKTYDKGGWNIPNIVYWLDVELPKEIEL